jgi:hypothetical protein
MEGMIIMAIEFNMQIIDNFDFIFEEKSNTFGALRKIKWSDNGKEKLDIRTYNINSSGEEVPGKGFRFSTILISHYLRLYPVRKPCGSSCLLTLLYHDT